MGLLAKSFIKSGFIHSFHMSEPICFIVNFFCGGGELKHILSTWSALLLRATALRNHFSVDLNLACHSDNYRNVDTTITAYKFQAFCIAVIFL